MEVIQSKIFSSKISPTAKEAGNVIIDANGIKRYNNCDLQNLTVISDRE